MEVFTFDRWIGKEGALFALFNHNGSHNIKIASYDAVRTALENPSESRLPPVCTAEEASIALDALKARTSWTFKGDLREVTCDGGKPKLAAVFIKAVIGDKVLEELPLTVADLNNRDDLENKHGISATDIEKAERLLKQAQSNMRVVSLLGGSSNVSKIMQDMRQFGVC